MAVPPLPRISEEVGAAIDGVWGTAIGITPANATREAGAAGADGWRRRERVKVWRRVSRINETGIRVHGVRIFPARGLPVWKTRVGAHVTPPD
jgi:hypothetical protein